MNITCTDSLFNSIDTSSSLPTVTVTVFMNTLSSPTGIYNNYNVNVSLLSIIIFLYQLIEISCSSLSTITVTVTFLLTAMFSSILTLVLTLLFVCVYIKRTELTRKEPVQPVEQDVYEEVQNPDAISPVPLTDNPAYGPIGQ